MGRRSPRGRIIKWHCRSVNWPKRISYKEIKVGISVGRIDRLIRHSRSCSMYSRRVIHSIRIIAKARSYRIGRSSLRKG